MKKFMPFWFWDVTVTEKKLASLHSSGYHLSAFSPLSGMFTFEEGDKTDVIYRICRLKNCGGKAPKGVSENGWVSVCGSRNIYIAYNPDTETKNIPSYKFWQTANRISILLIVFLFCHFLGFLSGFGGSAVEGGRFVLKNLHFISAAALEILLLILLISGWKANKNLSKTSADLGLTGFVKTIPQENFIYSKEEEKQMLKSGQMIKRNPLGWFYAPDKAEKMVEEMALKGWKFYRFDEMGVTFYFIKSQPCHMKFVVDYQGEASDDYYLQGKDDGWKLEFTSIMRTMCFVVWSKEYSDDEECPEFYTDGATMLKRAQRMALTLGIPMMLFAIFSLVFSVILSINEPELIWIVPIYLLVVVEFVFFGSKSIGFYLRMRKKHNQNK
ncbi:MAG: DUF2812 domain-containing protein [Huintestinicola sp.]|uniref:DUF2812 domain-containing protein n=1 Tax=Huintestinicola sp. TaxID=2981661 RepID=UPI003F0E9D31